MPSRVVEYIEWNKICFYVYYPCDASYVQKKAADVPHETCLWGTSDTVKCNESDLTENGCWYRLNVFAHILHSLERIQFPAWLHIKCLMFVPILQPLTVQLRDSDAVPILLMRCMPEAKWFPTRHCVHKMSLIDKKWKGCSATDSHVENSLW